MLYIHGVSNLYDLERQLKVILGAVRDQGIEAQFTGRNDITLMDGRKFSGNAFKFIKDKGLMHGTLLLNTDSSVMARYLQVSKAVCRQRSGISPFQGCKPYRIEPRYYS